VPGIQELAAMNFEEGLRRNRTAKEEESARLAHTVYVWLTPGSNLLGQSAILRLTHPSNALASRLAESHEELRGPAFLVKERQGTPYPTQHH